MSLDYIKKSFTFIFMSHAHERNTQNTYTFHYRIYGVLSTFLKKQ